MSKSIRNAGECVCLALLLGVAGAAIGDERLRPGAGEGGAPTRTSAAQPFTERWLEVYVNEVRTPNPVRMLQTAEGLLHATASDLERWRIRVPAGARLSARGKDYFALDQVEGLAYEIDERTQAVYLRGRAEVFVPTVIRARPIAPSVADPPSTGAFFNYDVQAQWLGGARRVDGLLEVGAFGHPGFGTSTFLARELQGARSLIRLETAWTRDQPYALRSLRLGDSVSRPGTWARAVYFGGVQWGTDFAVRPDFVAFPLPTVRGEATRPSVVDLYVDNALRISRDVPAGPFTIPDVPVITGEGEVRLVVRDALGRERILTQPYFASAGLLRAGLHDYTYEAGFVRRSFGLASHDYGRPFAAGTHRVGLSERLTGELGGELEADQQTVGVGATHLWPRVGVIDVSGAVSASPSGRGGLLSFGIERRARRFGFAYQARVASPEFAQLGAEAGRVPRLVSVARASYASGAAGAWHISHVRRNGRDEPNVEFLSAGYSVALFGNFYLSLFGLQSLGEDRGRSVGITLTHAPRPRTTVSGTWSRSRTETEYGFQVQQSLPYGPGAGYRLAGTGGDRSRQEAALFLRGDVGTYGAEVARADGREGLRLSASGGVAILGGRPRLSRRLDESFALVKVGGYADVPVFVDNQLAARTDAGGMALLPSLRAYERNELSIDQSALPLDARVAAMRMPVTLPRRSGKIVEFPVRSARGALLTIVLEDGLPMPAGATVQLGGEGEEFPVALRGEAYVTGLGDLNELHAVWKGRHCTIRVAVPRGSGPLPVLGPFICRGVTR